MQDNRRFVDASIFVNWLKKDPRSALDDEAALTSGYILSKIESGETAITTSAIKDEICIWLSRYKAASLKTYLELLTGYTSLDIVNPTLEDEMDAGRSFGKYRLGFTDTLTLSVMKRLELTAIYSSDTGFDSVPGINRVFSSARDEQGFRHFTAALRDKTKFREQL